MRTLVVVVLWACIAAHAHGKFVEGAKRSEEVSDHALRPMKKTIQNGKLSKLSKDVNETKQKVLKTTETATEAAEEGTEMEDKMDMELKAIEKEIHSIMEDEKEADRKMKYPPKAPTLPIKVQLWKGLKEGMGKGGMEQKEVSVRGSDFRVPILNIQHEYRYPEVEVFSYSDGAPVIKEAEGGDFDVRPFSDREDTAPEERQDIGCGGSYDALTGIITSPHYPFNYQNNIRCVYRISLPSEYTVGLDCNDFSVQPGDIDCENDFLEVSDNGKSDEPSNRFCGDKAIASYSASNNMTLVFQTDANYRYRGFMCRYRALNADGTGAVGTVETNNNTAPEHTTICTGPGDDGWAGKCGISNGPNRIVGGSTTIENEFPWMVAVLKICGKDMDHFCHICGGTVIHSQWILTGAHCIVSVPVETIAILLGDHNLYTLTPSQKFFRVEAVYVHPDFNVPSPLNNDVALAKLPQTIAFSQHVAPICIPPKGAMDLINLLPRDINITRALDEEPMDRQANASTSYSTSPTTTAGSSGVSSTSTIIHEIFESRNVSVFGWGTTDDDGSLAQRLRGVSVKILPNDFCDYYYGLMTETMMCTSGEGGHGPCRGDSGSPAQMQMVDGRWLQVGVLAFGAAFGCEVGYPSGNVLLPVYVEWLQFVTGFDFTEYY